MNEDFDIRNESVTPAEKEFEKALRPLKFSDFSGQSGVVDNLEIFVEAAKYRGEPLDHTLLHGPPGLGKTTLSNIIANELGVGFKITSGPVLDKPGDLAGILTSLEPNDVLFIDEIHRLSPVVEEYLYSAMEDYRIDIMIDKGPSARSIQIDLNPFTLVGATTRSGLLTAPLRARFGINLHLEYYDPETLQKIIRRSAMLLKVPIEDAAAVEISRRSRGTPRIANSLLRRVRDFAQVKGNGTITYDIAQMALKALNIDQYGLDEIDNKILTTIIDKFRGGPVGVGFKITSGPVLDKPGDLAGILTSLEPNDVLFIDEIHRLSPVVEEYLYSAMEDYRIDIMIDKGPSARSIQIDLNPFTLVGATTRSGLLTAPLRARFGINLHLEYYDPETLQKIIKRSAMLLKVPIEDEAAVEISRRSRGTPRIANSLLRRVRDFAQVKGNGTITFEIAQLALKALNIDQYGLDEIDNKILTTIIDKFRGGPVGVSTIATAIGEDGGTVEEVYEPFLIMEGFIKRTPRGRMATKLAYDHLGRNPYGSNILQGDLFE